MGDHQVTCHLAAASMVSMAEYEYTTMQLPSRTISWTDTLNQYGSLGWRLVIIGEYRTAIFEREVAP